MTWLESFLVDYPGAVVFVTHDRVFLQRVGDAHRRARSRPSLTSWPGDYATFLRQEGGVARERSSAAREVRQAPRRGGGLAAPGHQGAADAQRRARSCAHGDAGRAGRHAGARSATCGCRSEMADRSGQMVFEADGVTKAFGGDPVVRDASFRVIRGDRIGLIGPNGSGKTTLLRLLIGELEPDSGEVRRGAGVQIAHYDQQREQLDPDRTVFDTIADGNDTVDRQRPAAARPRISAAVPVSAGARAVAGAALSGGERNRLLLARLFTRPVERARARRADQRSRHRDAGAARSPARRLARHAPARQPRPRLHRQRRHQHAGPSGGRWQRAGGRPRKEYVGGYEDWLRQRPQPAPPAGEPVAPAQTAEPAQAASPCRTRRTDREEADLSGARGARGASGEHRSAGAGTADPGRENRRTGLLQGAR